MNKNQKSHLAKAESLIEVGCKQIDGTKRGISEAAAEKLTLANKELLKAGKITKLHKP